ncbi:FAD-dependent oxidoreductase [Rhizobium gallicum]|uniref:FAD-dependent oxidoreductase n=1 Tax=Rhizobium gallicum TaxID=56730 RepID=UPI003B8A977B
MAEIVVLGAGMVGVFTALALQADGHGVTIVDRTSPGRETSFTSEPTGSSPSPCGRGFGSRRARRW